MVHSSPNHILQLIEAHESTLRAVTLSANGSLLATASHKGTVIRVWDVATSQNVYEFRRGVERAQITCLVFSWDDQWLSCASDKGTTHIFFCNVENKNGHGATIGTGSATSFLTSAAGSLFSSSSKKLQPKSVCQIRGVPHPLSCAFISGANNLISVAGWDADGNGVLLISEFAAHQEARRVAYHVLVKNALRADETEEQRRRRRARGWTPSLPETPDHAYNNLQIGEMEAGENYLQTQTTDDDFCEVIMEHRKLVSQPIIDDKASQQPQSSNGIHTTTDAGKEDVVPDDSMDEFDDASSNDHDRDVANTTKIVEISERDSTTHLDLIQTEPLPDDDAEQPSISPVQ
jgi:hypothetical protein